MSAADWIAERHRIEQAASEGPWEINGAGEYVSGVGLMVAPDDGGVSGTDVEFIADARTAMPKALNALEAVLAIDMDPIADGSPEALAYAAAIQGVRRAITEALT